jgi:hypothetical protein
MAVSKDFFSIACSINSRIINPPYQVRNKKKEKCVIIGAINILIYVIIHNIRIIRER